jgi:hypothetical protein
VKDVRREDEGCRQVDPWGLCIIKVRRRLESMDVEADILLSLPPDRSSRQSSRSTSTTSSFSLLSWTRGFRFPSELSFKHGPEATSQRVRVFPPPLRFVQWGGSKTCGERGRLRIGEEGLESAADMVTMM